MADAVRHEKGKWITAALNKIPTVFAREPWRPRQLSRVTEAAWILPSVTGCMAVDCRIVPPVKNAFFDRIYMVNKIFVSADSGAEILSQSKGY